MIKRAAGALPGLVLGGAFYMLLIDTVSLPELCAGAGGVLLAWAAYEAARRQHFAEASIAPAWLVRSGRVFASVPKQIVLVSGDALAQLVAPRPARGSFRTVSFAAGGDSSRDIGRRALAEGLGSLAPNTIVIGVDRDRDLLLVHQLHRGGGREQMDVLDLG